MSATAKICNSFHVPLDMIPDPDESGFVVIELPVFGKRSVHVSDITFDHKNTEIPYVPEGSFRKEYRFKPSKMREIDANNAKLKAEKEAKAKLEAEEKRIKELTNGYVPNTSDTPNKGDIFCCSWGWEQTNIDWYQVVGMTKSGKSVRVRQLESNVVDKGNMTGISLPSECFKGNIMTKRIKVYDGKPNFKISDYATARAWDGKHKTCSWYA